MGGITMAGCMCVLASLGFRFAAVQSNGDLTIESDWVGYVCIVSIYIYVVSFAYSWGPVCWLLPTEIFPLSQRAKGVSMTTGVNFLFNFLVGLLTPYALSHVHWGLFYFFAGCLFVLCIFVHAQLPETKGVPLESIAQLFEPGVDWRAQREMLAEESGAYRSRGTKSMPTSSSYDDLLSASLVQRGKAKQQLPRDSKSGEEALLNP